MQTLDFLLIPRHKVSRDAQTFRPEAVIDLQRYTSRCSVSNIERGIEFEFHESSEEPVQEIFFLVMRTLDASENVDPCIPLLR